MYMPIKELIWSRIIEKEWLYVTDEFTKKKILGERPKTIELGNECPGRVGAWIGWQIVKHIWMRPKSLCKS